jgi:hypothetical protein
VDGLEPGSLVVARRVVDERGTVLWEGDPPPLAGARAVVFCAAERVADTPAERTELARASGGDAVDLESGRLAATGRLTAVVRAISDTPGRPAGRLASAARPDGATDWRALATAVALAPLATVRTARGGRAALAALASAAGELGASRTR